MLVSFGGASIVPLIEEGLAPLSLGWYALVDFLSFVSQVSFILFFIPLPDRSICTRWIHWIVLPLTEYYVWEIIIENTRRFIPLSALEFFVLILSTAVT